MPSFIDITGKRFGRLTVLSRNGQDDSNGHAIFLCKCDCGVTRDFRGVHLRRGIVLSCGCLNREIRITHGMSCTSEYSAWNSMLQRCENPNHARFKDYGARGIKVCRRWHKFENFIRDMGIRPKGKTLDRQNNEMGYEPKNCAWVSPKQNANNRRKRKLRS